MSDTEKLSPIRKYEGVIILHPDTTDEDQKAFFKKNKGVLDTFKGTIHSLDTWGKRKLANPIGKLTRGVYFHTTFEAEGDVIKELERTMRINDRVLRFKHTRLDDRTSVAKYLEQFKGALEETMKREKEREEKFKARKAAAAARRQAPARG
ncbi:MAG: 30S ribosomal protein S6 [Bdellovibrionales bacterium]|nr:30S ribosomal protein S6 [Bdellovibrionales bacterium]